ncbi:MAG TPA: preprotein translocase subunit YajC [Gemmatimonadaceae bacterium]|jgi:preprotein translocase subunit YajC|nr:preprotein translocase subunit YajC [Gemmatimonadaceae bacterium]
MTLPLSVYPALMASGNAGQAGMGAFLFEIIFIVGIFYFMLIRPQQKRRKQHEHALSELRKGDQVVTAGGVVGDVIHIKTTAAEDGTTKPLMDDRVTIQSGDTRLIVERGRISKISNAQGTTQS